MDAVTEKQELELEALIDSHGLAAIVDAVARVCVLKAELAKANWPASNSEALALYWHRAARTVSEAALSPHLDGL